MTNEEAIYMTINDKISLHQIGEEHYDCTCDFNVILNEELTVGEFINIILTDSKYKNDWWGYFKIHSDDGPRIWYKKGETPENFKMEILSKKIIKATANGGWSRMDFIFYIEKD